MNRKLLQNIGYILTLTWLIYIYSYNLYFIGKFGFTSESLLLLIYFFIVYFYSKYHFYTPYDEKIVSIRIFLLYLIPYMLFWISHFLLQGELVFDVGTIITVILYHILLITYAISIVIKEKRLK